VTTATPPAPYSTLEGALASGFAITQLHHSAGHDRSVPGFSPSVRAFGDETSVALLAAQRTLDVSFSGQGCFRETHAPERLQVALAHLGLHDTTIVQKRADGTHLNLVAACLREKLLRRPDQKILQTGRAASIQTIQGALRSALCTEVRIVAHALWAEGKVALG
jgi:hypothetical protein